MQSVGMEPPWLGRDAPCTPAGNAESSTASLELFSLLHDTERADRMRVIFIKVYKAGSTTVGSIIARLAITHGWRNLKEVPGTFETPPQPIHVYDCLFNHNFFRNGNSGGSFDCAIRRDDLTVTWCGGYQPWMDFYVPSAWRLVMVAEPVARVPATGGAWPA